MKDTGTAYLLLIFFGGWGVHRFYLNSPGMGVLYLFTCGLCGIGFFLDLFLIPGMVDDINRKYEETRQPRIIIIDKSGRRRDGDDEE